jgi:hypothetical protein
MLETPMHTPKPRASAQASAAGGRRVAKALVGAVWRSLYQLDQTSHGVAFIYLYDLNSCAAPADTAANEHPSAVLCPADARADVVKIEYVKL